jgi:hypothetical protein
MIITILLAPFTSYVEAAVIQASDFSPAQSAGYPQQSVLASERNAAKNPISLLPAWMQAPPLAETPPPGSRLSGIGRETSPNALSKETSPNALSEETSPNALSGETSPNALSEEILPNALSEEILPNALSEETLPNALSEETLPNALSEETLPNALSEETLPNALSEETSPNAFSEETSPNALSEETSPNALSKRGLLAAGDIIEVFTNTWSYSTIGLVYVPGRDIVRYAHESQSSTHNPTIYDVEYALFHTVALSFALSAQNSGWPWQLDNRTGAGYDFIEDTYFLPDYNGDLSYADDNIVEVDVNGTIINAWEMDDEVGSNDSSDGSEIDSIIDIAVVPGTPTRYFATAAYDDNVVYEIELTKTGNWWTPNSWRTVATYTIPIWDTTNDNLGIDYDAEHEWLYHASWDTTTIAITDLNMNPITEFSPTFDCPGAGNYNSGVTYIEGSSPPEVWVTDFSSDQTTRCEAPGGEGPPLAGWGKWIDDQRYDPDLVVTKQVSDVITITDVITTVEPFTLTERWDPTRLSLYGFEADPPVVQVISMTGSLDIIGRAGPPEVVTITKQFHVEPCDWLSTTLQEDLIIEGEDIFSDTRSFVIEKRQPELWIASDYATEVLAGSVTSFTLTYGNLGGFENDVWISNTFPITAPFIYAEPFPDRVAPDGTWARWDVGDLANDARDTIGVYVFISETVPASNTATIWDGIFDHVDVLQDETWINYHITGTLPTTVWDKQIDGQPWRPGISVTMETSQTFVVEETIVPPADLSGFALGEEWNPEKLRLLNNWSINPIDYRGFVITTTESWNLIVPPGVTFGEVHILKEFHTEPCTWTETLLWESLVTGEGVGQTRPVIVNKRPSELHIDSFFDVYTELDVYSREEVTFTLAYSNTGGFESFAWIENEFPPEAPFVRSDPPPTERLEGEWAKWDLEALDRGERGTITVTVLTAPGLPPSTTIEIWDGIFNHVGELRDETIIAYHVPPPTWDKWVNGRAWEWDLGFEKPIETSSTFTVTDVIDTRSAIAIVEYWNPERLILMDHTTTPDAGIIQSDTGSLFWEFPEGAPGTVSITKWFHVEPCTWTYTVLWEELIVEDELWERRPVHVDKIPPDLRLESNGSGEVYAGQLATFTLVYSNTGGYENDAWITNTFPINAPFVSASLTPTRAADDGTWAAWRLGDLETGEEGDIDVTVAITESLVESDTIEIWDGIFHDRTWLITDTIITYHVTQPPHTWTKWIDGERWTENISLTVETSDTLEVVDVISTVGAFELVENWDPNELDLVDWAFDPPLPVSEWFTDTGAFVWHVPPAGPERPQVITLTKWFHVEPCTWTTTTLWEELWVQNLAIEWRDVRIEKLPPELWLTSEGGGDVYAGGQGRFTLIYSNTGGRENGVVITNIFPISAPLAWANPDPIAVAPDGTWARWEIDTVDQGTREAIEVTVDISETLEPSTTIEIWDGIFNHLGALEGETVITMHVQPPPDITWHKRIGGASVGDQLQSWDPDFQLTVETSDTVTVTDIVTAAQAFTLNEEWIPDHLALLDAWIAPETSAALAYDEGWLTWNVTPTAPSVFTLTKRFHVEPCTWTATTLWEELLVDGQLLESRPIPIEKRTPELWLESQREGTHVYAGDSVAFTLIYSNTGGLESSAWITNAFPPEAPFVSSTPTPTERSRDNTWVMWDLGTLENGTRDTIDVIVALTESLVTSTTLEIWDGIYNHIGELMDWTVITYHVTEPPYTWTKRIDEDLWTPDMAVTVETSDTMMVTDVMSTVGAFELIEQWNPDELLLTDWTFDPPIGTWFTDTGAFIWRVPPGGLERPQTVTVTKWFHVEPCTWTQTTLHEELWLQGAGVAQRDVHFEKRAPELWLDSVASMGNEAFAGGIGRFTLVYSNTGGLESSAWITNIFPISAPLAWAEPQPDAWDEENGLWARWDLGSVAQGARASIEVTVDISETLPASSTVRIWDGLYNHVGELEDETVITYHILPPPDVTWRKWISGVSVRDLPQQREWRPNFSVAVETSDTLTVTDVITALPLSAYTLILNERWDPAHLTLLDAEITSTQPDAGDIISDAGWLDWHIPPSEPGSEPMTFTMTKVFHVEPCTWTLTTLEEDLLVEDILLASRPVAIEKWLPELALGSTGGGDIGAGAQAMFTLIYTNTGGYENNAWIENVFPPEAPFVSSTLTPTDVSTDATWVRWDLGALENGAYGTIDVTVDITGTLTPCHWITITDWIYNHVGEPVDETMIKFHVVCQEVTGVTLTYTPTSAIYTDTTVYFEAYITPDNATKPYTTTIDYDDGTLTTTTTSADPLTLDHVFDTPGTYTVTIKAWNCDMAQSEAVTDRVTVTVLTREPCIQLDSVTIAGATQGTPGRYTFTADHTPTNATPPVAYTWDDNNTMTSTTRTLDVGPHTLMVTATNPCSLVTDTHTITITAAPTSCIAVTSVDLMRLTPRQIYTDTLVQFSADIVPDDADKPYTYTMDYGAGPEAPTPSSADPLTTISHTFTTTGTHTVEIAVWNCTMQPTAAVTDDLNLTVIEYGAASNAIYLPLILRD